MRSGPAKRLAPDRLVSSLAWTAGWDCRSGWPGAGIPRWTAPPAGRRRRNAGADGETYGGWMPALLRSCYGGGTMQARNVTDPQLRGWQRPVDHRARHRPQLDPRQSAAVAVSGKQRRAPHLPWRRRRLRSELYGGP